MKKTIRWIGICLVGLAILLVGFYFGSRFYARRQSDQYVDQFHHMSAQTLKNNTQKEAVFDYSAIQPIDPNQIMLNHSEIDPNAIIGQITAPSIEMNLTIFKGTTDDILSAGAGTMRPDQQMGEGAYPLASHHAWSGFLFADIIHLQMGDRILITDKNIIYEYAVIEKGVFPPTATYLIQDSRAEYHGRPLIQLMNCEYDYDRGYYTGNRLFVFGELVDQFPYHPQKMY